MDTVSLRERKKLDTREAIARSAKQLFATKGYGATTLQDIATKANVSQRTIFSYFPSKEAIIFDHHQQLLDDFMKNLEERGDKSVFDVLRALHVEKKIPTESERRIHEESRRLIESDATLQEHFLGMLLHLELRFAELAAEERGMKTDSIEVHLIAASLRAGFQYMIEHVSDPHKKRSGDTVLRFIEGGVENIQHTNAK